jgi:hypothetical protein
MAMLKTKVKFTLEGGVDVWGVQWSAGCTDSRATTRQHEGEGKWRPVFFRVYISIESISFIMSWLYLISYSRQVWQLSSSNMRRSLDSPLDRLIFEAEKIRNWTRFGTEAKLDEI